MDDGPLMPSRTLDASRGPDDGPSGWAYVLTVLVFLVIIVGGLYLL